MENFEELVKQFVEKKVDKDNPAIVTYKPVFKKRAIVIDIDRARRIQQRTEATAIAVARRFYVVGPDGTDYNSIMDASRATNIEYNKLRGLCKNEKEGWKIVKMES